MRIGIISDTHGLLRPEVMEQLNGCNLILHAGDINKQEILDRLEQIAPVKVVRGNNDKEWAGQIPYVLNADCEGLHILMCHKRKDVPEDLTDTDLILTEPTHSNTQYSLTAAGKETLCFFEDKLNEEIKSDVLKFFEQNKLELRQENSILADYYKTTYQKYAVRCQVRSDGAPLIDLTISVSTKEQAETICNNWKNLNEDVYALLMDLLLQ